MNEPLLKELTDEASRASERITDVHGARVLGEDSS